MAATWLPAHDLVRVSALALAVASTSLAACTATPPSARLALIENRFDALEAAFTGGEDPNAPRDGDPPLLMTAVSLERPALVAALLEAGARTEVRGPRTAGPQSTPLIEAAVHDSPAVLVELLRGGADVDYPDGSGRTALWWAAKHCKYPALQRLLEAKADLAKVAREEGTTAADEGLSCELGVLEALLAAGARVNPAVDGRKQAAALGASPPLLQARLALGANPNGGVESGATPLHGASPEAARALLQAGARPDVRLAHGGTALSTASPATMALLLQAGADPNFADKDGTPPLVAVASYDGEAVELLLAAGANPGGADAEGRTALHRVADAPAPAPSWLRRLLQAGTPVNAQTRGGASALLLAAGRGRAAFVAELIAHGADVNLADRHGATPLIAAARGWDPRPLTALLQAGADPARVDAAGRSALSEAVAYGRMESAELLLRALGPRHPQVSATLVAAAQANLLVVRVHGALDVVKRLLEAGADPNAFDRERGTSPLCAAATHIDLAVLDVLLEAGADVNARGGQQGRNALMCAVSVKDRGALRRLLARKPDLELRDAQGKTALMLAVRSERFEAAAQLARAGAKLDVRYPDGEPLLHALVVRPTYLRHPFGDQEEPSRTRFLEELAGNLRNVDATTTTGRTALMAAAAEGDEPMLELLLAAGAKVERRDREGSSALHHAAARCQRLAIERLLRAGADTNAKDARGRVPAVLLPQPVKDPYDGCQACTLLTEAEKCRDRDALLQRLGNAQDR